MSAICFNPNWSYGPIPQIPFPKTYGRNLDLSNLEITDWVQINLEPLALYTAEGGQPFSPSSSHRLSAIISCQSLPPPAAAECPSTSPVIPPPALNLSTIQYSSGAPPATHRPSTLPPTPAPPTLDQIRQFDFCPFTMHGQICRYFSWARSSNKQIKRHMKAHHFPDSSLGYECPNPKCNHKNSRFLRKDACVEHRRSCDSEQGPDYVPLPHIERGSDKEVNRWMEARCTQKRHIIQKLKGGTPWSTDLLEPVSI